MNPSLRKPETNCNNPLRSLFPTVRWLGGVLFLAAFCARAVIVGPYSVDSDTLHLWHLDENAVPVVDAAPNGTNLTALVNGASLGNESFNSFGKAMSAAAAANSYLAARTLAGTTADDVAMSYVDTNTGAFTYEAVVRIDFNPATFNRGNVPLYIVTGENDGAVSTRAFQFRMHTNGVAGSGVMLLHIFNPQGNSGLIAEIPSTGPNALAQGNWYHTAVTYNGNAGEPDSLKLYWTRLDQNPTPTQAFEIASGTMASDLPVAATPDFVIGNVGRGSINGNFVGLIDEVRMSKVARHPQTMLFGPSVLTIVEQPTSQTIEAGKTATLRVAAAGPSPIGYQWRLNGSPIEGATQNTYTIPSAQPNHAGQYTVRVTNSTDTVLSDPATLTLEYLPVAIVTEPANETVALGQAATFSVVASGTAPLSYQWRHKGTPLANATNSFYSILSVQAGDAGNYDVVVTNAAPSSATSQPASLTIHTPVNLTWLGSAFYAWDATTINWDSNSDFIADRAYIQGDRVRFDDNGSAPSIDVSGAFHPSSVVVTNSGFDYVLSTTSNGRIVGNTGLLKQGSRSLSLDIDNAYSGPTVVEAGTIIVGNSEYPAARGSLGTGPITNQARLVFDRTGTLTMTNAVAGNGELIKTNTLSLRLLGSNTMSGPITVSRGNLTVGPGGLGSSTSIALDGAGGGDGTSLTLTTNAAGQGTVVGAGVTLTGTTMDNATRVGILNEGGTNIFNGSIVLNGGGLGGLGVLVVRVIDGALELNGPITGPTFSDVINFRGNGTNNFLRSRITLPVGGIQKDDGGTWTVNSTGNSYLSLRMLTGTLKLGSDDALATTGFVKTDGGILDLAGFNQTVSGLANYRATPVTTIANSSTISDSRLRVVTTPADPMWISGGIIADSTAGGTRKVALTLAGGATLMLTNASTFSGDTTIEAGTLALSGNGALVNSTPIILAAGTTLDVSGRADGKITLGTNQVLKGNGAFNVMGSLVNNGTIELKLNKTGAVLTNDSIQGLTAITYGGTLKLNVTANSPLALTDSFKLFHAGGYSGEFVKIVPSAPALGLAWDTSTLATDGTLRFKTGPATDPTTIVSTVVNGGTTLQLAWPDTHKGWTLQVQTNALSVGLSGNWVPVPDSYATNRIFQAIIPANSSVFYRLVYP